jgi:hypothetical protein
MRKKYMDQIALPPDIKYEAVQQDDEEVNEKEVNKFVDGLKRPAWYHHDWSNRKDTRLYMMEVRQPFKTKDDTKGKLVRYWTCDCCQGEVLYEGLQIGHIEKWRDELKRAGVLTVTEAQAVYNNLNNLRIECSSCNESHDWE